MIKYPSIEQFDIKKLNPIISQKAKEWYFKQIFI